jgi:hypothetical protein
MVTQEKYKKCNQDAKCNIVRLFLELGSFMKSVPVNIIIENFTENINYFSNLLYIQ